MEHSFCKWHYDRPGNLKQDDLCTSFITITGPDTLFPDDRAVKMDEIKDGTSNTLMVAEIDHSDIAWHEPRDLPIKQLCLRINGVAPNKRSLGSDRSHGVIVGMADGSVYVLANDLSPETLKSYLTIDGHANVRLCNGD